MDIDTQDVKLAYHCKTIVVEPAFDLLAWADELEDVSWYDATLAKSLATHGASTPQQLDKLHQLFTKHPERKDDLLAIFSEAVLAHGRNVLHGEDEGDLTRCQ